MMMKALMLASLLITATALVAGASDATKAQTVAGVYETKSAPLREVALMPVDKNGNPYGNAAPWAFYFDLNDEPFQPRWVLASMAQQVAAYLKAHPGTELRIDEAGAQGEMTVAGTGIRDRRIAAIRAALLRAGVPSRSIKVGPSK
jgi:hypothetical protein